jgi:dTDP-glucose 4,6-dehydratase
LSWHNQTILVTGAGGFIGSHLTERLVEDGARVRAFVRYKSSGSWGWLDCSPLRKEIEVVVGDVSDRDSVRQAARGANVIFHLAALIAIPYSYHSPTSYIRTNVEGTLNVLQCAREADVDRVVHTSTSEVYGTARYVPIDESHPLQGQSPYSASKIGADKIAESFYLSFELPVTIVRPFNTFGPRQSARAVIPAIITQCLSSKTVNLGNIHPTRDLTYVTNIVEGFLLAASKPEAVGQTINLGSGHEISVGKLSHLIANLSGRSITIRQKEERIRPSKSEVGRLLADNTLARKLLGWKPTVSFEDGLKLTIGWFSENKEIYRPHVYSI